MSLFYTRNELSVAIVAPIDGEVLSYEEAFDKMCGKDGLIIRPFSDILRAPLSGSVTNINPKQNSYTLCGANGEKVIVEIDSPCPVITCNIKIGKKITMGEQLCHIKTTTDCTPIIQITLENSNEFRWITVFEGKCRSTETEIMSFCK